MVAFYFAFFLMEFFLINLRFTDNLFFSMSILEMEEEILMQGFQVLWGVPEKHVINFLVIIS